MEDIPDPILDPAAAGDWQVTGPPRVYLRDTLSEYIDGGAALYLGYSFRWVAVWQARSEERGLDATIELYCFDEPADALGIYLNGAHGADAGLPFERSQVRRGLLRAQQGPCFVRALCRTRSAEGDEAARSLGRAIGSVLPVASTELPAVLRALPQEGRRPDSLRYFHTKEALDAQYYLGDENLLDLSPDTECGWALYEPIGEDARPTKVCLVRYPERERLRRAAGTFAEAYLGQEGLLPGAVALRVIEDGTWAAVLAHPDLPCLALVLDAESAERARDLCRAALEALEEEMSE